MLMSASDAKRCSQIPLASIPVDMERWPMIDLLVLITLFAFAIPSLRNGRATRAHLAHIERRMERLEAMHYDALVKLGYGSDEIRAAYPRMPGYGESTTSIAVATRST